MSISVDALVIAIEAAYQASPLPALLSDDLSGPNKQKWWHIEAKENIDPPYVTYRIIDAVPDYRLDQLSKDIESVRLSFTIIDDRASVQGVNELTASLDATFGSEDETKPFESASYKEVRKQRVFSLFDKDDGVWVYTLDYDLTVERK